MTITTVFTNNRSQAVRLPADVRLPEGVKKVEVRAKGADRIISPVGQTWDQFFLHGPVCHHFVEALSRRYSQSIGKGGATDRCELMVENWVQQLQG